MTPSQARAPAARLSVFDSSPRCTFTPDRASTSPPASLRASPSTSCPAARSSFTIAVPMKPLAPVTNTRMVDLPMVLRAYRQEQCRIGTDAERPGIGSRGREAVPVHDNSCRIVAQTVKRKAVAAAELGLKRGRGGSDDVATRTGPGAAGQH